MRPIQDDYVRIEITLKSGERVSWQLPIADQESTIEKMVDLIEKTGPIGHPPGVIVFTPYRGFVVASEIAAVGVQGPNTLSKHDKELMAADHRFRGIVP